MMFYFVKTSRDVKIEFGQGEIKTRCFFYVRPEIVEVIHRPSLESFRVIPLDDSDIKIEVHIRADIG